MSWEPDPLSHDFLPVAGHPDDDECTDREDGTDATYCGLPEAAHSLAEECAACDTPLDECPMPDAGCCDDCTHAANFAPVRTIRCEACGDWLAIPPGDGPWIERHADGSHTHDPRTAWVADRTIGASEEGTR